MANLNDAHPIFDALVEETSVDSRLTKFRNPDDEVEEQRVWREEVFGRYDFLREDDLRVMSGEMAQPGGARQMNKSRIRTNGATAKAPAKKAVPAQKKAAK